MLRVGRLSLLALLLAITLSTSPIIQAFSWRESAQAYLTKWQITRKLSQFVSGQMTEKDIPGVSLVITQGPRVFWEETFGLSHLDPSQPLTHNHFLRMASVSKIITALAVMQLVEQGVLDLDESITTYLPELEIKNPFGSQEMTLRQLLSHRSGLGREPPRGHYHDTTRPSLQKTAQSLSGFSLAYEPIKERRYSNAGFAIAGAVIEKVTDQSFPTYVKEHIFAPLGMEESFFTFDSVAAQDRATGYLWHYQAPNRFEAPEFGFGMQSAIGLISTVRDMSRLLRMFTQKGENLYGQKIFDPTSLDQMMTPQFTPFPWTYGLGFFITPYREVLLMQHTGQVYGFSSRLLLVPEEELGILVVSNLEKSNEVVDRIAFYALDLMLASRRGEDLPDRETLSPLDPAFFSILPGYYRNIEGRLVELFCEPPKCFLDDGEKINPLSQRKDGDLITDGLLGYGEVLHVLNKYHFEWDGVRFSKELYEPPPAPSWAHEYLGKYGPPHARIEIVWKNGRLRHLEEFWYERLIYDAPEDHFRTLENKKVIFIRNNDGQVVGMQDENVYFEKR